MALRKSAFGSLRPGIFLEELPVPIPWAIRKETQARRWSACININTYFTYTYTESNAAGSTQSHSPAWPITGSAMGWGPRMKKYSEPVTEFDAEDAPGKTTLNGRLVLQFKQYFVLYSGITVT